MEIVGTKYQIYEGDELKIRRLYRIKSSGDYVLKERGIEQNFIVTPKELAEKYVRLAPDAFLNIMISKEPSYEGTKVEDVYFCVNKATDLALGVKEPSLILRQNIYSRFKNMYNSLNNKLYIGECATILNTTKEELSEYMTFEEISKQHAVATYIDDSEDDILTCIPNKFKKDINATLLRIKSTVPKMCEGATETLKQLWEENDFIGNYKSLFNIIQIDFPIVLGKESYDANNYIVLNEKQKQRLENMLKRYISNIIVIKYDKDIDISKIVNTQHIVVSDLENKIYLIAYDVDGYYTENEEDVQVLKSFGLPS